MTTGKVDFTGVQSTMLVTLFLRAAGQQRHAAPILGDRYAAEAVDRIDYDWAKLDKPGIHPESVLSRAADQAVRRPGRPTSCTAIRRRPCSIWPAGWTAGRSASTCRRGCGGSTSTCPTWWHLRRELYERNRQLPDDRRVGHRRGLAARDSRGRARF